MLRKKMIRDIKNNLSQFITIFLMVFIGVLVYAGIASYMDGMVNSANKYYKKSNLQDLNIISKSITKENLDQIKKMDHVKDVERKIIVMTTEKGKKDKTIQLNFIETNNISKFHVFKGEKFDADKKGIWVDNFYAENNNIKIGDEITLTYEGVTLKEKVVGLINVPDHVYDIKDESELFPTHKDYGFAYVSINEMPADIIKKQVMKEMQIESEEKLEKMIPNFNYKDYLVFNYAMVDVDASKNKVKVKEDIEKNVNNIIAVSDIKDSISYSMYQSEIEEGETYIGVFSGLFLFIALLSVITTMTRVIKKQRTQIGTLKALGYSNRRVTLHYVGYGFWISLFSSIAGLICGPLLIGNLFIGMEMSFFEVPNGHFAVAKESFIVAILVVIAVSIVTYFTCRKYLKENPAETLRVQMPKVKEKSLNLTTKGLFKKLSFSSVWNARDIFRNKVRTMMGIAGIVGCAMLLVCAFGMLDSMNGYISWQFNKLYNFKYKFTLNENYTNEELNNIVDKYGDNTSETLNIEFINDDKKISNTIYIDNSNNLVRFTDEDKKNIKLKDNGIYITSKLAETENLKIGDTVKWHIYGQDKYYETKIIGFDRDPQTQNFKMTRKSLEKLGIEYKPDTVYSNKKVDMNKKIAGVELIQDISSIKLGIENMISTMKSMIVLIIVVAVILGIVIIYNLGVLSFTEKQYQFATLKVLGFKDKQIKKIYTKQNNWITLISIIIGLPLGYLLLDFIFVSALSDGYDFNAKVELISYIYAALGTLIVSFIVSKILGKKVNKIDMVTSLKGNE